MPSLTDKQTDVIDRLWAENAHHMGFAVSDSLSYEAFAQGYAMARGWAW